MQVTQKCLSAAAGAHRTLRAEAQARFTVCVLCFWGLLCFISCFTLLLLFLWVSFLRDTTHHHDILLLPWESQLSADPKPAACRAGPEQAAGVAPQSSTQASWVVVAPGGTAEATPGQGQGSDKQQQEQEQQDDSDSTGACAILCAYPRGQGPWQG
ncbi:hypothetical protein I79_018168 [Cricetulus griseus]|uniref:Uncharacterized protein n=1 Tax=Cricetulus griseus TaxID=10029 RepID=G3I3Z7_CRIGR|nr:hypothetical protein I79_018168 [Cricetulus griseus]